jgi:hypothetical protein
MRTQTIDTPVARLWIDGDRVIHIHFKPTDKHGIDEARSVVSAHNQLAAGSQCPVLADIQHVTVGANRDAREYYVSEESSRYKTGMAMIVSSPMQRMLGNIFFKINRPPYPTRLFSRQADALKWLHELEDTS